MNLNEIKNLNVFKWSPKYQINKKLKNKSMVNELFAMLTNIKSLWNHKHYESSDNLWD